MLDVLRQRNFALLWIAGLISILGDHLLNISLPFYVYARTGSVLATGAMLIAGTAPRILMGSVAGAYVDRWDQQWTMVVADLIRVIVILGLFLIQSPEWFWLIYLVTFLQSTTAQFFNPAKSALLPLLVKQEYLIAANSLDAMSSKLARLVGPPLGGALLGALGMTSVILLDSISFLISGGMLMFVVIPSLATTKAEDQANGWSSQNTATASVAFRKQTEVWKTWLEGLRLVRKERVIATLFVVEGIGMVGEGIINVLWVIFVQTVMQGSALELGWLSSTFALGALLGGVILARINGNVSATHLIGFSRSGVGLIWLTMLNFPFFPLALILLFLNGIVAMGYGVSIQTLLQVRATDRFRGRVFGTHSTTNSLMRLGGMGLALVLGDRLGAAAILNIAASLFVVAGIVASYRLRRFLSAQLIPSFRHKKSPD